ncbi:colicin transporter [Pseudomonas fluorescens]|uniref:S-type pyocin domain-containing protein n=1 Tax=Pseudomonas fluorescens TaxID=294 RepID=UPI0011305E74|nr:S-type pyocin domain-containing protein [Pseudomonas fluorescens]TMU78613.1 colicin transporter [Pseudomonas fluorescens]
MQKPPPFVLTEAVHTTATAPPNTPLIRGTSPNLSQSGTFAIPNNVQVNSREFTAHSLRTAREFQTRTEQLPQSIEQDLAATRLEGATHPLPPAQAIIRELGVRHTLTQRKTAEFHQKTAQANQFFGDDPLNKDFHAYFRKAQSIDRTVNARGIAMQTWAASYRAAHEAKLLAQSIQMLNQQQVNVQNWLAAVQTNDQAQAQAAAEARRVAAEHARIALEQQRQREIAEAARQEQEQIRAREQARLATLAKKQDMDAYLAKYSAQLARILAEMRAEAREQARIAALKSALAEAQAKAEAAAQAFAAEQARLQAQMEQRVEANQQEGHSAEIQHVYPASGAVASTSPVLSFASKTIRLPPASSSGILSAMRTGLLAVKAAGAALISGPVLVGFAALLMPSRLGNGERFSMSVPLAELSPESPQTLREIADQQGTLELPVGLGVRRVGAGAEIFVATSDDFHIRSSVLVLNAAYDLLNDVYEVALPDSPTDFLTWTPAISPGNSSTVSPIAETDAPAYSGAPIVPIEGRLDLNPILVEGWERFVIVFPDDSGIAPLYMVFSSPYGGVEDGEHSGRDFNPEETGLPVTSSDWVPSIIAKNGIDIVKLHTSKFPDSDANKIMIDRLERIFRGELEVTDTDKRFYTHEIREFERLKALGYGDTEMPDKDSSVWNNVHTATLEDYKLKDAPTLLYTPEALEAARRQEEREYQKLLKEIW